MGQGGVGEDDRTSGLCCLRGLWDMGRSCPHGEGRECGRGWEWEFHGRPQLGASWPAAGMTLGCLYGLEQRQAKFLEHKLKCTKARNEYLLSLASVNAAVSNYYLRDVLDLMDVSAGWAGRGLVPRALGPTRAVSLLPPQCCDTGFHLALGQVLRSYTAAESRTQASQMQGLGSLEEAVEALDRSGGPGCSEGPAAPTSPLEAPSLSRTAGQATVPGYWTVCSEVRREASQQRPPLLLLGAMAPPKGSWVLGWSTSSPMASTGQPRREGRGRALPRQSGTSACGQFPCLLCQRLQVLLCREVGS